jgi:Na+/H+ antiporter NhaD/arsenite permease-like protein
MFGSFHHLNRKSSFVYFQDPIILSGTAFLAYLTRASSNILNPRAWITAQFAVANISSAILVSSNPTNLVLAGAFDIRFIDYTGNMVGPSFVELTRAHRSF